MSDEPSRDPTPAAAIPMGIWEHRCEHSGCDRWGGFGYSIGGRPSRWYCDQHMDDGERLLGRA